MYNTDIIKQVYHNVLEEKVNDSLYAADSEIEHIVKDIIDYEIKKDSSVDINDIIADYADGAVDVYRKDLLDFALMRADYIEQAVEEGFVDLDNFDFDKLLSAGEYCYYSNKLSEVIPELEAIQEFIQEYDSNVDLDEKYIIPDAYVGQYTQAVEEQMEDLDFDFDVLNEEYASDYYQNVEHEQEQDLER